MKTTIKYKIDGGGEQEYTNISPFDLDGVLYLFFNNRNRRNRSIEIVSISREKA